jgi:glyoxylase-like metal-dependent hydrolase (beta-lactamase superfamily II)
VAVKKVVSGLYQFSHGGINAFLLEDGDRGRLTLIDTGFPKQGDALAADLASVGHSVDDLTSIVITHAHPDHLGNAKRFSESGTTIALHPDDTEVAEAGILPQTMVPGPGLLNRILYRVLLPQKPAEFAAFTPQVAMTDGDVLDIAGGLEVIHTPGHTAGHVSLLWKRDRGLLFTGDAATNMLGLNYTFGYNDVAAGKRSLTKLSGLEFEAAVFGHGNPITAGASEKFTAKFGKG